MQELKGKMNRIKPIIRARKVKLDQETEALEEIRSSKKDIMSQLRTYQKKYGEAVNDINQKRQHTNVGLEVFDSGIDLLRNRWYECVTHLREVELQEAAQLRVVIDAKRDLKSVEKLEESYEENCRALEKKIEQKTLDELAAMKRFIPGK